jgi:hypothetical protein
LPARHGSVELRLRDGRTVSHLTTDVKGTSENQMTRDEVDEKEYHLLVPVLGAGRARALCDAVWSLESLASVRELGKLLRL